MSGLELARAAFRDGARALDPDTFSGVASPSVLGAWLCVQTVRTQPKWLKAAAHAVQSLEPSRIDDDDVADWVDVCCRGWVQQAIGPFRAAARGLLPRLPERAGSAPALLGWWRITGERAPLDRALALLRCADDGLDPALGVALRLGYQATADESLRERALAALGGLDGLEELPWAWPALADLRDLDAEAFAGPLESLRGVSEDPSLAAQIVPAAAALALPPLVLEAQWFMEEELREGPMAEAATFPWAALRLRFGRLAVRDQIHFVARYDGGEPEELEDVGVVAPWLSTLVARADRGPLLDGAPMRTRRRGGLRRR